MENFKFRTLRADEIDVRVGTMKDGKGTSFLLYKDARCDMAILDETVGTFGWMRDHKQLKDVIYCGVSLKSPETGEWLTKWDAGAESNTEAEKGEASDSFKRACVNWGIGRELYTAPFIWIAGDTTEFKFDKLRVSKIEYNDKREISKLELVDKNGTIRYTYPKGRAKQPAAPVKKATSDAKIDEPVQTADSIARQYLLNNPKAFEYYQANMFQHVSTIDELTTQELNNIYGHLKAHNKI